MRGTDHDVPFVAFDYQYDTETSDGRGHQVRTTHHFGVLSIPLPTALPPLQVTPEDAIERAAHAMGIGGGIDLESEDFNRRFTVHAHDPKFASDVLTPRTMEALLAAPPLAWRIEMADLVAWWDGALKPVELLASAATLRQVVSLIPSFVWHDNGVVDPSGVPSVGPSAGPPPTPTAGCPSGPPRRSPTARAARQRRHRGARMSSSGRRGSRMPLTTGRSSARTTRRRRRSRLLRRKAAARERGRLGDPRDRRPGADRGRRLLQPVRPAEATWSRSRGSRSTSSSPVGTT